MRMELAVGDLHKFIKSKRSDFYVGHLSLDLTAAFDNLNWDIHYIYLLNSIFLAFASYFYIPILDAERTCILILTLTSLGIVLRYIPKALSYTSFLEPLLQSQFSAISPNSGLFILIQLVR